MTMKKIAMMDQMKKIVSSRIVMDFGVTINALQKALGAMVGILTVLIFLMRKTVLLVKTETLSTMKMYVMLTNTVLMDQMKKIAKLAEDFCAKIMNVFIP